MKIKVIYEGSLNVELDKRIREVLEENGFRWYAQGYNIAESKRDVCFDVCGWCFGKGYVSVPDADNEKCDCKVADIN